MIQRIKEYISNMTLGEFLTVILCCSLIYTAINWGNAAKAYQTHLEIKNVTEDIQQQKLIRPYCEEYPDYCSQGLRHEQ